MKKKIKIAHSANVGDIIKIYKQPQYWSSKYSDRCPMIHANPGLKFPLEGRVDMIESLPTPYLSRSAGITIGGLLYGFDLVDTDFEVIQIKAQLFLI